MWKSRKTSAFFASLERDKIVEAIQRAEAKSFGEIRVHLHHGKIADARAGAEKAFRRLGMDKTRHGSGCLVFIAPDSRAFAVIGGAGIHEKVGETFWGAARDEAQRLFAQGKFTEGIVAAIDLLGEALTRHFPKRGEADTNERPDDVTED
jgi:uncharacterized membrane protein